MVALLAPNPFMSFAPLSGNRYTADANGVLANAAAIDVIDLMRDGCLPLPAQSQARNNFTATADPGPSNDLTQDFGAGSIWFNLSNNRTWMCQSAAAGAAIWYLDGVVIGAGVEPSGMLTQFGASSGSFAEEGNINRQISGAGIGNGADTTDDVLFAYSMPANAFDQAGRGIQITANGKLAANANNKRIKLWFGGQVILDSGVTAGNGVGWQLMANVFKYGAAGSNTQYAQGCPIIGATHGGINLPAFLTVAEQAAIVVQATGSSPTTGAANDVIANFFEVNAMN